jgi:hypothetical protein
VLAGVVPDVHRRDRAEGRPGCPGRANAELEQRVAARTGELERPWPRSRACPVPRGEPAPRAALRADGRCSTPTAQADPIVAHSASGSASGPRPSPRTSARPSKGAPTGRSRSTSATWFYALSVAPVAGRTNVNIYGREVTEQKRAEKALREREDSSACSSPTPRRPSPCSTPTCAIWRPAGAGSRTTVHRGHPRAQPYTRSCRTCRALAGDPPPLPGRQRGSAAARTSCPGRRHAPMDHSARSVPGTRPRRDRRRGHLQRGRQPASWPRMPAGGQAGVGETLGGLEFRGRGHGSRHLVQRVAAHKDELEPQVKEHFWLPPDHEPVLETSSTTSIPTTASRRGWPSSARWPSTAVRRHLTGPCPRGAHPLGAGRGPGQLTTRTAGRCASRASPRT